MQYTTTTYSRMSELNDPRSRMLDAIEARVAKYEQLGVAVSRQRDSDDPGVRELWAEIDSLGSRQL